VRPSRATPFAVALVAAAVPSGPAWAGGGGAAPLPPTSPTGGSGGTTAGQPVPERARERTRRRRASRRRGPVLESFRLHRPRLFLYGHPARVSFRIGGRGQEIRVSLRLVRAGRRGTVRVIPLGWRRTGTTHSVTVSGREGGALAQGSYLVRIAGRDRLGRGLRRSARASGAAELSFFHHRFPLVGSFDYGGEGSRFGAPRRGHRHQGQDLAAAYGVPVVSPRGGVVEAVGYQASAAGHYVVVDGEGEDRDYVFMHLADGSVAVRRGQWVRTGQRIGVVGSTGSSTGPHLHFEVWVGGWYSGGRAIDPLPLLRVWDRWS
jgi:murein DD-endopeptidase MepM/ murein hydrolase activator NlpD